MYEIHSSFIYTLGGISLFMFGMSFASENLQKLMANRMRDLMSKLSNRPFYGVIVGMALTFMIQSSGAVTSMLVGLGSSGVITLRQVMSVILGTAIGTTFTVQLLSLNIVQYGMAIFSFSFVVYFLSKKRGVKQTMAVVMGFGMIFWGLELISTGTMVLKNIDYFKSALEILNENPLYSILLTAFFTAIVHSSAVTIGFAMSLASTGMIDLSTAIYWVYGANIGTTATALLAATGGNYVGRQVAWAHFFYKVISVLIFYVFTDLFAQLMSTGLIARDIANSHTVFNVAAAIIFLPFVKWGSIAIEKLFPASSSEKEFGVKFLDRGVFDSSSVALANVERELLRMGDIVALMVKDSIDLFKDEDLDLIESIKERDTKVDILNKEINLYLADLIDHSDAGDTKRMLRIMTFASDLESAADVIDNSILELSKKKHFLKVEFSKSGWEEMHTLHAEVSRLIPMALSCFQLQNKELAEKIIESKRNIRVLEKRFKESHMRRLVAGKKASINTSSIHLDALNDYRRIAGLVSNYIYHVRKTGR